MYVASSRELWLELEARFGESNSPMIYQFHREIGEVMQGNMTTTEYYTKLKRLWDEHMCLAPTPKCICTGCSCGINKAMADLIASNHLIQFLVGLNAVYDQSWSQILLLEPLPSVTKAYPMLLRMEKHMQKLGHTKDSCLKLHGVPDWYKDITEQRKKSRRRGRSFTALVSNDQVARVFE
ncbi:UNVERIFIED_CONTAM: hypothetical protein Sindi_0046500, partial [Sesamum indicum]